MKLFDEPEIINHITKVKSDRGTGPDNLTHVFFLNYPNMCLTTDISVQQNPKRRNSPGNMGTIRYNTLV